jgi:hypothetical protein
MSSSGVSSLIIYKTDVEKIRIGNQLDGGYVVGIKDELNYDALISCGIGDDLSFEVDFLNRFKDLRCFAFDGNVNIFPQILDESVAKRITFYGKNIGPSESSKTTNLLSLIEDYENIFLKMDIESHEYEWINILKPDHLRRIKQIVIEFHFPFTSKYKDFFVYFGSPVLPVSDKVNILKKMTQQHILVHLHANNFNSTSDYDFIKVPDVFECTYVRKDSVKVLGMNDIPIPHPILDFPNNVNKEDIFLHGFPFSTS